MKRFRWVSRLTRIVLCAIAALIVTVLASNAWIVLETRDHLFQQIESLPPNEVGLLLGTSRYVRGGGGNPHFEHRIEAAARLYRAGKIQRILASGHHDPQGYDEPYKMHDALVRAGVPEADILLDLEGFRTLESIARASRVFGLEKFTIISQEFHNARAVFIARRLGLEAVAFCAEDVPPRYGRTSKSREYFARVKALIDLFVLGLPDEEAD